MVVGLYDRLEDAQQVVRALVDAGFHRDNINLISRDEKGEYTRYLQSHEGEFEAKKEGIATGAGAGAVLGGIGGLLVGLGALAIPGIGPVIAAGPILSALAGAGVGAAVGGLVGALVEMGVPEDQANRYAEGIRRGGTLVLVRTDESNSGRAVDVMNRFNPIDINRRVEDWRSHKWTRFDERAKPLEADEIEAERLRYEEESIPVTGQSPDVTIPVVEEDVRVGKREVERGGVRISTYTTEEPFEEQVNLRRERVDVERHPVDRPATDRDIEEAFKDRTMDVTEKGEEAMIQKEARVTEEVHVRKDVDETSETVRDTVRRTEVDVDRLGPEWNRYETRYQEHFRTTFGRSGHDYDYYRPAYAFGYELAHDERFRDLDRSRFEMEARREWERRSNRTAWDDIRDAVYHAWESIRR